MTNNLWRVGTALFLLSACEPVSTPQLSASASPTIAEHIELTPAETAIPAPAATYTSDAADRVAKAFLFVRVIYTFGQLGETTSFSITQEDSPTPGGYHTPSWIGDEADSLEVVLIDGDGQTVLRQTLPVVFTRNLMPIDGGLVVKWAIVIPNDRRYECAALVLEGEAGQYVARSRVTNNIEPPLHVCDAQ